MPTWWRPTAATPTSRSSSGARAACPWPLDARAWLCSVSSCPRARGASDLVDHPARLIDGNANVVHPSDIPGSSALVAQRQPHAEHRDEAVGFDGGLAQPLVCAFERAHAGPELLGEGEEPIAIAKIEATKKHGDAREKPGIARAAPARGAGVTRSGELEEALFLRAREGLRHRRGSPHLSRRLHLT